MRRYDRALFRFQSVRAVATHELSLRTVGDFFGLQFFVVGPILLPVLLSAVTLTAWRGIPAARCDSICFSASVIVPFAYFLWKSLTLRVRRHLADVPVADRLRRRRHQYRDAAAGRLAGVDDQVHCSLGLGARSPRGSCWWWAPFSIPSPAPWNFFGKADPIGGEAGYEQVASRAREEMQKIGASWIATTDYRTYAMLRWYLKDRVPVVQINERGRFLDFRDPGMHSIEGQPGLYVAR